MSSRRSVDAQTNALGLLGIHALNDQKWASYADENGSEHNASPPLTSSSSSSSIFDSDTIPLSYTAHLRMKSLHTPNSASENTPHLPSSHSWPAKAQVEGSSGIKVRYPHTPFSSGSNHGVYRKVWKASTTPRHHSSEKNHPHMETTAYSLLHAENPVARNHSPTTSRVGHLSYLEEPDPKRSETISSPASSQCECVTASTCSNSTYSILSVPNPPTKPTSSSILWLSLYFIFNLALTLYNKKVLFSFPFPWTLTAIHAVCGFLGCSFLRTQNFFKPAQLSTQQYTSLFIFSFLYTINIAISNLSLQIVTIPFHQVVRSSTPLFILLISYLPFRTRDHSTISLKRMCTLVPIVLGVALASYGDYYFTPVGLFLTLFGTFLAALKTTTTHFLQTTGPVHLPLHQRMSRRSRFDKQDSSAVRGTQLHPLDILYHMGTLASVQCIVYAWLTGELNQVLVYLKKSRDHELLALTLVINGVVAFGLNVVSFTANKKVGPLSITVAANVKQVLTILLAISIFDLHVTATNVSGIALTLIGGAWYGYVEWKEKKQCISSRSLSLTSQEGEKV